MSNSSANRNKVGLYVSLIFFAVFVGLIAVPRFVSTEARTSAASRNGSGAGPNRARKLANFDIRTSGSPADGARMMRYREKSGVPAFAAADKRDRIASGLKQLIAEKPAVRVEFSRELRVPEVITPDVWNARFQPLSGPSSERRSSVLREFVRKNESLFGISEGQAETLERAADYANPSGNMGFAELAQKIDGIPVFQGRIKAGFTKDGRLVRVVNNLAPGLGDARLSGSFGDPEDAVRSAAGHVNFKLRSTDLAPNAAESGDLRTVFGEGDWATTAEKTYFPTEIGVARAAWQVIIWEAVDAYLIVVDAETGEMLWRKNLTEDQSEAATFEVYRNTNAYIDVAESPAPLTPGPTNPGLGTQGSILTRENVLLVGNEGELSFNELGWINDGNNFTDGNAVQAGIDRDGTNGVDATQSGDAACPGAGCRVFSSAWNPPPGDPAPGDMPLTAAAQRGAVIQMFYVVNRYHDILYQLGFTEPAHNFQNSNFGKGGNGSDRVSAEGQDSSGTGNANFATAPDGTRGRMQMYIFTGPNPDRDGTTDAEVIIHELTHGTSNRLHGNATGLGSNMSRGMGEGWGDWYAHTLLAEPSDPINGIYTIGGYLLVTPSYSGNFYYGIRRFPKAVMSFTGGPNNRPHNPLTFADLNVGCDLSDGAFAPRGGGDCDQVHNAGEIWSSALWEIRARMIQRLGFPEGTRRVLQVVTDGMKLAPQDPTFLQERDAIIAAAYASTPPSGTSTENVDVQDIWEGFRIRGMGFSASVENISPAQVTEAFDLANVFIAEPGFAVSDSPGDNDTYPESGEPVIVTLPLKNTSGVDITNVTVSINGGQAVSYGTISDGTTVSHDISLKIPAQAACGGTFDFVIDIDSSRGASQETRTIVLGAPSSQATENFDGVTAPALPAGWTTAQTGSGVAFVSTTNGPDTALNSLFTPNTGGPNTNSGATVESVEYPINAPAGLLSFRNKYNTEGGWDGGVLEININGGGWQDIVAAGGGFLEGGYNGTLGANGNPLDDRPAWTGNSGGYITSTAWLPEAANGAMVRFRWRFGEDDNTQFVGWNVDSVTVTSSFVCDAAGGSRAILDFDGDGKTDISIFRPNPTSFVENSALGGSSSQWWIKLSGEPAGLVATFGSPGDYLVPRDYTGDGKADIAFFRPSDRNWYVLRSEDMTYFSFPFGVATDIPAPGDFDGDGIADPAVYRASEGTWYIKRSSDQLVNIFQFGLPGDWPTVADFDGDGMDDVAIYRNSDNTWWQYRSSDGLAAYQFGTPDALTAAVGDYTGDGKADVAFFAQNAQRWYILRSEDNQYYSFPWGTSGDKAVPGDYDGDGIIDAAVFRSSDTTWYIYGSSAGYIAYPFGLAGDVPVPSFGLND